MKIGLLQCDDVAPALIERHGNYPDMIQALLRAVDPRTEFQVFACHQGQMPDRTEGFDGWITTGSKCGANDDADWIEYLATFIRTLAQARRPLVGICFGHQLMAKALGGQVERSPLGWGLGAYTTTIEQQEPWMSPWESDQLQLLASHQDQVAELPPQGRVLARNGFCPIYMMQVGDTCLGLQGHPEFTRAYLEDLVLLRQDRISHERRQAALHSLRLPVDNLVMGNWILNFFRHLRHLPHPAQAAHTARTPGV
ncbi:glutamine amidotransferase-related protein [Castellaniella caeni]|uniref:glutamine amidotransferase-related protein n=1 Tax=Castellaniella caeni TaxID=266123 RepID=UPI000C9EF65D|nr:gamma-glutamyl-gamma-aminobutyrate hydrolase family protein [Castellaniella caeni]